MIENNRENQKNRNQFKKHGSWWRDFSDSENSIQTSTYDVIVLTNESSKRKTKNNKSVDDGKKANELSVLSELSYQQA